MEHVLVLSECREVLVEDVNSNPLESFGVLSEQGSVLVVEVGSKTLEHFVLSDFGGQVLRLVCSSFPLEELVEGGSDISEEQDEVLSDFGEVL